jgi:carboxylesterase
MPLEDDFTSAQARVRSLPRTPSNDDLLALYGLYKQATVGDVSGPRPGMLDFRGRAKYDAWTARKGMAKEQAMQSYVVLVGKLVERYR